MNAKQNVMEAQAKIVDELAAYEDLIATLYTEFSQLVTGMKEFWTGMAREEKMHASMLRSMHKLLEQGHIFFGIGRFDHELLQELNGHVRSEINNAQDREVNRIYALSVALKIETSLVESRFYEITTSDAPQFKIIAERLCDDTCRHQKTLQAMVVAGK